MSGCGGQTYVYGRVEHTLPGHRHVVEVLRQHGAHVRVSVLPLGMHIRWGRRKYTQEQFVEAWNSSASISEVARKLDANRSGSGFYSLRDGAKALGLNQDHMVVERTERSANALRRSLVDVLIEHSPHKGTSSLKERLYREGLLVKQCSACGISEWRGIPAPLALDHINGVRDDNRIENLRILCYNCHGQTANYGFRNTVPRF